MNANNPEASGRIRTYHSAAGAALVVNLSHHFRTLSLLVAVRVHAVVPVWGTSIERENTTRTQEGNSE